METENVKFLTSPSLVTLQDTKKSFEEAHWDAKNYWISTASLWNSTTVTTLINMVKYVLLDKKHHIIVKDISLLNHNHIGHMHPCGKFHFYSKKRDYSLTRNLIVISKWRNQLNPRYFNSNFVICFSFFYEAQFDFKFFFSSDLEYMLQKLTYI